MGQNIVSNWSNDCGACSPSFRAGIGRQKWEMEIIHYALCRGKCDSTIGNSITHSACSFHPWNTFSLIIPQQVIDAWARSDHQQAGEYADAILSRIEEKAITNPQLTPNRVVLNSVMHAHSRQGNIGPAERIFQTMKANPEMTPQIGDYNALLSAFARNGDARKAEALLKEMLEKHNFVQPDIISYNCVLDAWHNRKEAGSADRAECILNALQDKFEKGESWIKPNARSYSTVAAAYIGRGDAVEKVQHLLMLAEERGVARDTYNYNILLDAWACSNEPDAAEIAEDVLLNHMEPDGVVNSVSYNTVIKAWKMSDRPDAAQRADAILSRMIDIMSKDSSYAVNPDVFTFTGVIDCYAKSKQPGAATKAVEMFDRMLTSCNEGNFDVKPNTVTLNCVLDALAKCGESGAADQAKALLTRVLASNEPCLDKVHLNTISYTSVIDAYSKSGMAEGAQKAEDVFKMMDTDYANGNKHCKPNLRTYNAIMNSWVQSGMKGCEERAEAILDKLEVLYESGEQDIRPDVISYSIVMNGWSRSKSVDASERTDAVFSRLLRSYKAGNTSAKPNLFIFVSLLNVVCKSGSPGSPQKAENIVRHMYKEYLSGNYHVKPNTQMITQAMDCWAKSGNRNAGQKAENLLNWMVQIIENEFDECLIPNAMTFNAVINAWAKSRVFGKAQRARQCLDRMLGMYNDGYGDAKPNAFVYTAVLNACAYTVGDEEERITALQIAQTTYKELCESDFGKPTHVTYGAYLTACRNLIPQCDDRISLVEAAFKQCCADGQLDTFVLKRVESALTNEQFLRLLDKRVSFDGSVDLATLPDEWKCNVQDSRESKGRKRPKVGIQSI